MRIKGKGGGCLYLGMISVEVQMEVNYSLDVSFCLSELDNSRVSKKCNRIMK